jgi:hypothetical protein
MDVSDGSGAKGVKTGAITVDVGGTGASIKTAVVVSVAVVAMDAVLDDTERRRVRSAKFMEWSEGHEGVSNKNTMAGHTFCNLHFQNTTMNAFDSLSKFFLCGHCNPVACLFMSSKGEETNELALLSVDLTLKQNSGEGHTEALRMHTAFS